MIPCREIYSPCPSKKIQFVPPLCLGTNAELGVAGLAVAAYFALVVSLLASVNELVKVNGSPVIESVPGAYMDYLVVYVFG